MEVQIILDMKNAEYLLFSSLVPSSLLLLLYQYSMLFLCTSKVFKTPGKKKNKKKKSPYLEDAYWL